MPDANVVIDAHVHGFWDDLISRYEVYIPSIILKEVKYYIGLDSKKNQINLKEQINDGKIFEIEATSAEMSKIISSATERFKETVHKGELEALAILNNRTELGIKFCTGDKAAIKALSAVGLGANGVSLEEVLDNIGQKRRLKKIAYNKKTFQSLLGEGLMEKAFLVISKY